MLKPDANGNLLIESSVSEVTKASIRDIKSQIKTLNFKENSEVTSIEEEAFKDCTNLLSVNLYNCNQLSTLNEYTFSGCISLSEVILPEHGILSTICGGCFKNTNITTIKFPASLQKLLKINPQTSNTGVFNASPLSKIEFYSENNLEKVEEYTFAGCSLVEFEIGQRLNYITGVAFEGNKQTLKRFTMRSTNSKYSIYENALYEGTKLIYCPNAIEHPKILPNCTSLQAECFFSGSFTECTFLPSSLRSISDYAFHMCENLVKLVFPCNVSSFGYLSIGYCPKLAYIVLPQITNIPSDLLSNCRSLRFAIISNGVQGINGNAFSGCPSLVYLSIPNTVTYVHQDAFKNSGVESCGITCTDEVKEIIMLSTNLKESSFEKCKFVRQTCGIKRPLISIFMICPFIF